MEKIINYENLRKFAYSNDHLCKGKIKGIVLDFYGLGGTMMFDEDSEKAVRFAEKGILMVTPYYNPWCWMNAQALAYVDEILDVLIGHYQLSEEIPIASTGLSMGGLSALIYTAKAKRTPVACVVNCPVCDLPYHYTERQDLPRTLYSAFFYEAGTMQQAMERYSPLHLAESMPDIDYYIFHCDKDQAVNKEINSDRFVEILKKNHRVTYHVVPDRTHCQLTDEMRALFEQYTVDSILQSTQQ